MVGGKARLDHNVTNLRAQEEEGKPVFEDYDAESALEMRWTCEYTAQ